MDRLNFLPDKNSYGFDDVRISKRKQIEGPIGIYKKDIKGQSITLPCTWTLTLEQWFDFYIFYKEKTIRFESFLIALLIETSDFVDYKAKFNPDSFAILEQRGDIIKISIELEIKKA